MPKMKKLPQQIAVTLEDDGSDDNFLSAYPSVFNHAVMGEKTRVGIYELQEIREVEGVASSKVVG